MAKNNLCDIDDHAFDGGNCLNCGISELEFYNQGVKAGQLQILSRVLTKAKEVSHEKGYVLNDIRYIRLEDLERIIEDATK